MYVPFSIAPVVHADHHSEDKAAPKSPLPQRPNSFCVPDDDDYPEEVVPLTVPTKCAVEDAYAVGDSDIASDAENEAPSEHTPMTPTSSKGRPSVEPDSADHPKSSQDPRNKLDFGPYSSPIGLCDKEPSEISQDDILHIDAGSNDDDDGADSYPGSMYEDEDLGRCSDWDYDNYSNDLDDGSRPELCVWEPKGGPSNEVNRTSVTESHNTGYAEPRNDMEDEIFIPWGSNTNSVGGIPKQKEAEGHSASSTADNLESGLDKSAPGPQLQGPEHFETESRRVPPSLAAFAPGPTMNPSGRTYDRGFPHYNHFAPPTSFQAYPPRGSSQYDPCLLSAQGNSHAPYRDGPFMSNQPIAPSGGSSTASNLPEPPYFGNLVDIAKRLDGSYQQREQPDQFSFIIADDKPSGASDNIKAHPSILDPVKPSDDVAKKSLKRKASEIELESPTSDSCVDPSLFEKRPSGDSALRTANTSQESFSQDAQRVPDGEAKCSISQLTDLHPIEKQHTESGPDGQPPRKRVNTGKKPGARSFATHATTAVVGAVLGGLGTIIALASLPPEYFN